MKTLHFFDDILREDFLPLTYTRPAADMRCGIMTNIERAHLLFENMTISHITESYLNEKYPYCPSTDQVYVNGRWILSKTYADKILKLEDGYGIKFGNEILALNTSNSIISLDDLIAVYPYINWIELTEKPIILQKLWDIFSLNAEALDSDWDWFVADRKSGIISDTNTVIGPISHIFLEEGAQVEASILNTKTGKIYVGKNAEIMEGSVVRGSLAMCEDSVLKLSSKVYGSTTIGKGCKIGGEVNNVVFFANSSKGHDGFLGNTVVGEWCNFGADTNNSNLKNNYEIVKLWSESQGKFENTGLQFCGLIMGDHSKCGINTMFNTGTVVGVSCNIFGSGFPRNFVPSFAWGGPQGYVEYKLPKALQTMEKVMERRHLPLTEIDKKIIEHIYTITQNQRNF